MTEAVALPGSAHDLTCARIRDILSELAAAGLIVLADPPGSCKVVGRNRRQVTVPAGRCGQAGRLLGRDTERFGMGPAVVLVQDLAKTAGPVRHGAVADLATGDWQLGDGHGEAAGR